MRSTIARVLVSAALSAQAIWISAQVDIIATRVDAQTWNYSISSSWPGANEYPVYFSIPLGDGVLLDTSVIALPAGFQVYGTRSEANPSLVTSFAVSAHEDAVPADMPGQGQTISGFQFRTTVSTVLESGRVLFGIGRFNPPEIVFDGETLGVYPVKGNVQAVGTVTLEDYAGSEGHFRQALLEFRPIGGGNSFLTTAGVDQRGWLYCQGPESPGNYELTIRVPGYLTRTVMTSVGTSCTFNAQLIPGDSDGDNEVGIGDFAILSVAYGSEHTDGTYVEESDFNGDLVIDIADYALLAAHYFEEGD